MKRLSALFIIMLLPFAGFTQSHITSSASIKKIADGLYLMYYDSTAEKHNITKSAIVEFHNYIVLLEMPIVYDGAGATTLKDHTEGGENVLQTLKVRFPDKPLKYVFSSHWHPHSISSIIPFISRGITVVTTRNNFKRLSEFVDSATFEKYHQYIHFVENDSMVLKDRDNKIVAYKLDKKDYPDIPTQDFLFFYLPKYNDLVTSCMFQRFQGFKVKGKEVVSGRAEDLNKFILTKNLTPQGYISTDIFWDEANGMSSNDSLQYAMKNGILTSAIENDILSISNETLIQKSDSIIKYWMDNSVPVYMVNQAIYVALKKNDLQQALALARIQALLNPSDPNVWDTFGEVYYFLGETKLAKKYERQSTRIDKDFKRGGEKMWEQDLKDFKAQWSQK